MFSSLSCVFGFALVSIGIYEPFNPLSTMISVIADIHSNIINIHPPFTSIVLVCIN